jgi:hypothetical protein
MLAADDDRRSSLKSAYRKPLDPRALVKKLETEADEEAFWKELWNELHHQGDVGDASYAAVPLLVETHRKRGVADWNTYASVSIIELARTQPQNPPVPAWLSGDYFFALQELCKMGCRELAYANDIDSVRQHSASLHFLKVFALTPNSLSSTRRTSCTTSSQKLFGKDHRRHIPITLKPVSVSPVAILPVSFEILPFLWIIMVAHAKAHH